MSDRLALQLSSTGSFLYLKSGKISVESPIGKGLLGKKVGEIAKISVPSGSIELEIVSITRD